MSTTPPPPSEQPSEPVQHRPQPKRNLAGVGFALIGGYFAYGVWNLSSSLWLKVPLLVVFLGVAAYGVVQLVQNRRR